MVIGERRDNSRDSAIVDKPRVTAECQYSKLKNLNVYLGCYRVLIDSCNRFHVRLVRYRPKQCHKQRNTVTKLQTNMIIKLQTKATKTIPHRQSIGSH